MKISFLGFGNMAKAIAESLCNNNDMVLFAAAPSLPETQNPDGISTHFSNSAIVEQADIIVVAVKPDKVQTVLTEINPQLSKQCVVLSIAAGVSLETLAMSCPKEQPIVRSMPNTPIAVGKGATALIANEYVTKEQTRWINQLFACSGISTWVTEENDIDALTALSGSGPAYVFLFLEAMIAAARELGIDDSVATTFALQTMSGTCALLETSGLSPQQLRNKVTSPAGTTAAAIAILQHHGFEALLSKAMHAAFERAKQLGNPESKQIKTNN